jgi:predicted dehydrogenase
MEPQTHLPKVSVALVGGGTIAPLHAEYLLSSPTCSLSAVIDPFPPGKTLATKLGVPYYDSIQSLLRSEIQSPDAYIICVPSSLHVHVATDVVTHGRPKAILIEKPFCTDSNAGKRLIEFAKSKSCQILVGHHRRFHPSIVAAREAIGNGKLVM